MKDQCSVTEKLKEEFENFWKYKRVYPEFLDTSNGFTPDLIWVWIQENFTAIESIEDDLEDNYCKGQNHILNSLQKFIKLNKIG